MSIRVRFAILLLGMVSIILLYFIDFNTKRIRNCSLEYSSESLEYSSESMEYSSESMEKSLAQIMSEEIENKDSLFCVVEEKIKNSMPTENYSYQKWLTETQKLIGVEACVHSSDFNYSNHECNILDYLNWHLIRKISNFGNNELIKVINETLIISDSLLHVEYALIDKLFVGEDTSYDLFGLALEFKTILNDDLSALYSVLSEGKFAHRRISQIDKFPYECPEISDSLINNEYNRFIAGNLSQTDEESQATTQISVAFNLITKEKIIWEKFISCRTKAEDILSGTVKNAWHYNTKIWKLNKIKQLKNEFKCYGTMSELGYTLSL